MLKPGTPAPALTLPEQDGRPIDLAKAWKDGPLVLFFFPKANTAVCTKEACAFRDAFAEMRQLHASVIGISRDTCEAQRLFATQWNLPFPLLSDTSGEAHRAYEVHRLLGIVSERITYVIDRQGTIIGAHSGLLGSDRHVRESLDVLRRQSSL